MNLPFKMYQETEMEKYRAETFWTKEPETIAWLDSMEPGDVLLDIGANVGVYSLYAASRGNQVYAVEPVPNNFMRFAENIVLNGFEDRINAYRYATGSIDGTLSLYIPNEEIGASGAQSEMDGIEIENARPIELFCMTIDTLITKFIGADITHIKIDVDGAEPGIVRGMFKLLSEYDCVKSILIECADQEAKDKITGFLNMLYFVPDDRFNNLENHSRMRRKGWPENIVYKHKEA